MVNAESGLPEPTQQPTLPVQDRLRRQWLYGALLIVLALVAGLLSGCQNRRQPQGAAGVATELPWTQADVCRVADLQKIGAGGGGFDWKPDGALIANTTADADGIKQIYMMNPDGSQSTCVTCTPPEGGPPATVHKGVPHWHPSGEFLVLQVEMEEHPLPQSVAQPGSGWLNNIWAMSPDGAQWWQLTDYGTSPVEGVLFPRISPDGQRVAWAKLYRGPDNSLQTLAGSATGNPWGRWELNFADLINDAQGVRLESVSSMQPGEGNFYETQNWSPDGNSLLFAADIGRDSPYVLDLWEMDVASGQLRALTDTDSEWEEQSSYSPDGTKIAFMSSQCCDWDSRDWKTLATELYLMDRDGANPVQLTTFNSEDSPYFEGGRSIPTMSDWSPDGTRIVFERMVGDSAERTTELWLLTFQGACGMQ